MTNYAMLDEYTAFSERANQAAKLCGKPELPLAKLLKN
ncbi:hypothetical protein NVI2019_OHEONHNH_00861 [Providencia alcalifaciens]|nr:hypothetical protein HMPREF1568_3129 [Providencia alcalifaciens PAL-3]ETT05538.1 hypothetical protein HMPREF1562_1966 [Providencia alcalifaciens F90-2004]EUC99269.1 hypothetical protein HMPREF1566_0542 [Providencia alcalifaciens PAL-1]CAG9412238.1 hypothetical protein NVI2019_OHEONHNH_00861 [Providencia alcalifaciens]CAG9416261.1 hypothetical protein NVI2019_KOLGMIGM_01357 [Providencia alcalifaciens]